MRLLDQRDKIRGMSASRAFDMVRVDRSPFECRCCPLDESGFVERVAVKLALDVVFLADPDSISLVLCPQAALSELTLERC